MCASERVCACLVKGRERVWGGGGLVVARARWRVCEHAASSSGTEVEADQGGLIG